MPISPLRLIKNATEFCEKSKVSSVPSYTRGIYVLYKRRGDNFNVVYIGMAAGPRASIRRRLYKHRRTKGDLWSHFSVFQVWENIREEEVKELEGLFRHLYKKDSRANKLNKLRSYKHLNRITSKSFDDWI